MEEKHEAEKQLVSIAAKVDKLEKQHNEVIDVQHTTNKRLHFGKNHLHTKVSDELRKVRQVREELEDSLAKVQRIPVLLSLLAREEEVTPLSARVDGMQYEFFATASWFSQTLKEKDSN